jgi:predicted homoserine dehydrogenase-like protein
LDNTVVATTHDELEDAVRAGRPVATDDAYLLARCEQIDALVDVMGQSSSARVALEAFRHGKHMILMNAELDATIGPSSTCTPAVTASPSPPRTATNRACR